MRQTLEPHPPSGHRLWNLVVPRGQVGTEVLAGATTFVVSSYIIFVNPAILGFAGIPELAGKGLPLAAVATSTCLTAGLLSLLMGLYSNRAFVLAPGMGLNAVIAFQLVAGLGLSWPAAMGVVVLEGLLITLLVLTGAREAVMDAVPADLKNAISVGIGLFILFIGLWQAGIVVQDKTGATPLALGPLTGIPVAVAVVGIALTVALILSGFKGALIVSILLTTALAVGLNALAGGEAFGGAAKLPPSVIAWPDFSLLGRVDVTGAFRALGVLAAAMTVFSVMLADFFDTIGTLVGVGSQAGYLDARGRFKDVRKPLLVDSLGAVAGGMASASSCTTYVESQAGVQVGGRTGLTAVVAGLLFLLFLPLSPLVSVVPKEATAGALVAIGVLMCRVIAQIDFSRPEAAWPAVATFMLMPLTYSITNGIGAGFVVYCFVRLLQRKRESLTLYLTSAAFLLYFLREPLGMALGLP